MEAGLNRQPHDRLLNPRSPSEAGDISALSVFISPLSRKFRGSCAKVIALETSINKDVTIAE